MSVARTQRERVLAKARSSSGVCRLDFLLPDVCDGGDPIINLPGRMYELDREGHSFEVIGKRSRCKVFRLIEAERDVAAPSPVGAPGRPVVSPTPGGVSLSPGGQDALFETVPRGRSFANQENAA